MGNMHKDESETFKGWRQTEEEVVLVVNPNSQEPERDQAFEGAQQETIQAGGTEVPWFTNAPEIEQN